MNHVQLTKNFHSSEFWKGANRAPTALDISKCYLLAATILQPLRDNFGPIEITRGISTPEHNAEIDGANRSHHLFLGMSAAADIVLLEHMKNPGKRALAFNWILATVPFGFGELGWYTYTNHFHIALPSDRHAQRVTISTSKKEYSGLGFNPEVATQSGRDVAAKIMEIDKAKRIA